MAAVVEHDGQEIIMMMDYDNDNSAPESSGGMLIRHGSQNSLDECSRKTTLADFQEKSKSPYRNYHHANKSFEVLNSLRKDNLLCDIKLVAKGTEIPAHRAVLASCSPYFNAMFTKFEERNLDTVELKAMDPIALEMLVEYIYTAEIYITEENVQVILPAANILQLTDISDACSDFLISQLHPSNVLGIRTFGDLHGCHKVVEEAEIYAEKYFQQVMKYDEFLSLSAEEVKDFIQRDAVLVVSEEKIFEGVMKWIRHDCDAREQHLPMLIAYVRLPLTSKEYLMSNIEEDPLLRRNLHCKDFIIEALKYHLLTPEEKRVCIGDRSKQRTFYCPKLLMIVGGQAPKAIRGVECYDFINEQWLPSMSDMPNRRCRAGVITLNDKVYAVGGFDGSLRVKTVDVYDPVTRVWTPGVPMDARRSTLGVAVMEDKIYAIGGFDGSVGLKTAEVFDSKTQRWNPIACMSIRRSSVGVGVLNGLLYAVGGYDGLSRQCLNTVECYNPQTDSWQMVPEMNCRRSGAGVGVLDGILYAVGGHDGPVARNTVEAFDPSLGTWTYVAEMNVSRRNAGVLSYMGLLYVVGGDDGSSNLSSVEIYNPLLNTWEKLNSTMSTGRSYAGVTLINQPLSTQFLLE